MKHLLKILLLILPSLAFSQDMLFNQPTPKDADSLSEVFMRTSNDTLKMSIADYLANFYIETDASTTHRYFDQALTLARKLNQKLTQASVLDGLSYLTFRTGDYAQSLRFANAGITIAEKSDCEKNIWQVTQYAKDADPHKARLYILANLYQKLAHLYIASGNNNKALASYFKALNVAKSVDDEVGMSFYNGNLAEYYLQAGKPDSALSFVKSALFYCDRSGFLLYKGYDLDLLGLVYRQKGNNSMAKKYFLQGLEVDEQQKNLHNIPYTYERLAEVCGATKKIDSGIYYARLALKGFKTQDNKPGINEAYNFLYGLYKSSGRTDSAFVYLQHAKTFGDSLNTVETAKLSQYLNVGFNEQLKVEELQKEQVATRARARIYVLSAGITVFMLLAGIFYRNNRHKQKANKVLEKTLSDLKATQTQLIQSEKMASLGELTAGIAHEIQNPLNFVNNFSEVSAELVDEMDEELGKGDVAEAKAIGADLKQNLEKIRHHGKRADAIVKGMLQHSQSGSGTKEPTNINALADEYIRLSYHGLRAKDKGFNAEMVSHFDEKLPKVNAIPQDIGRVLLNLFNNAFYAVNQKQKTDVTDYKPEVSVSTSFEKDHIIIKVKDNGVGIPDSIKEKIMQPFFTTKPTGEGTGLGLSLTYDMVVKGHGGSIDVNTREGEFTEFTVTLPL